MPSVVKKGNSITLAVRVWHLLMQLIQTLKLHEWKYNMCEWCNDQNYVSHISILKLELFPCLDSSSAHSDVLQPASWGACWDAFRKVWRSSHECRTPDAFPSLSAQSHASYNSPKHWPLGHLRCRSVCFRFGEILLYINCSSIDPLQWMGAVRMRVFANVCFWVNYSVFFFTKFKT